MQKYQDTTTGEEWHFDDGVDVPALPNVPTTLSTVVNPRPSAHHVWSGGAWVLDSLAAAGAENAVLLDQIRALELKQLRPLREYALGDATALPRVVAIDVQIAALRSRLQ